jgi:hypothetical protein
MAAMHGVESGFAKSGRSGSGHWKLILREEV